MVNQISFVLTGGKTVTYDKNDIDILDETYEDVLELLGADAGFMEIRTDDGKDRTIINRNHIIAINVQYDQLK